MDDTKILLHREPWTDGYALRIMTGNQIVVSMTTETLEEGAFYPQLVTIRKDAAEALFQQLWDSGTRPIDGTGSAGQLLATENHLEDMRELVFDGKQKAVKK